LHLVTRHFQGDDIKPQSVEAATSAVATQNLADLRETLGLERMASVLDRYETEIADAIAALSGPMVGTLDETAQLAHRLAGSSAALGAVEMRAALVEIENAAKANDPARLRKMIARLAAVWANTQPMLRADRRDTPRDVAGR
jgi:HPt (histidine-containing phosphotransfer) domain-containing protein